MVRLFLNKDVVCKSKDTFSCIYHKGTGWYYPCKPDFWRTLQGYKAGKEINLESVPPALSELVQNKFLIEKRRLTTEDYLLFYPIRFPGTVYLENGDVIDVAVERIGAHGETDFDIYPLKGFEARLWTACDGTRTLKELARELDAEGRALLRAVREWVSIENQMMRLLSQPLEEGGQLPNQLIYKAPFLPKKKGIAETSTDDVRTYHLDTITDGIAQFDRVESTLSHLYRVPHPILGWKSYGQALYRQIKEERKIKSRIQILEIGGGMGSISTDIFGEMKKDDVEAEYVIYDLSPGLIRSQRELHRKAGVKARHIHGNGETLALKDESIDIALSNEVIADFQTPEVNLSEVKDFLFDQGIPMTHEFFHFYRDAPEKVRVNLGAFLLLKELYRVLKPGGMAVITEYGYQDRLPFRAKHLDHPEYTIQFSQMISVATALGFGVRLTDAWDYLGFRNDIKLMTHFSFQAAFRILEPHNTYLPNITYSEDLFRKQLGEKAENFRGLMFVEPLKDPFKIVKILICEKP